MSAELTTRLPSSWRARWLYALKPASWPKLLVPTCFGQALGAVAVGSLNAEAFAWGVAFTVAGLGFIVLLNDWGDREVDAVKRDMFPDGCSPKTIPDRILGAGAVGLAGVAFGLAALLIAAGSGLALDRPSSLWAGVACMAIFAAYTLPPIRLNYRGGGELLEMVGVGVALPIFNAYLQAGGVPPIVGPWIAGFALLSLSSAIASGLSDEESDRAGGKRTFASMFGNAAARRLTELSLIAGAAVWAAGAAVDPGSMPWWVVVPVLAIVVWHFAKLRAVSADAETNAFVAQGRYKHFLHGAIWHSTTVATVLLLLRMIAR